MMHSTSLSEGLRPEAGAVGGLLRDWRQRRRLSQMELALDTGISPRHLSFIETQRSRPSPEVLMALAQRLEVPLRERNTLLLSAGYAPRYVRRPLQAPEMRPVQEALKRLLDAHQPYPGVVLDRQWNVVLANDAAMALAALVPAQLREPRMNVYRATLHPEGLARLTVNFAEWTQHLVANLRRSIEVSGDAELIALEREVLGYPNVQAVVRTPAPSHGPALLVPHVLDHPAGRLSLFTTLTSFGTPRDITLDELCVELFYPADEATAQALRMPGPIWTASASHPPAP